MTKRDIVLKIAQDSDLTQNQIAFVVQKTLDYIADELVEGNNVELRDFGVFEVQKRKARKGRNPNKPKDEVIIPERLVVKFKTGKELKQRISKLLKTHKK